MNQRFFRSTKTNSEVFMRGIKEIEERICKILGGNCQTEVAFAIENESNWSDHKRKVLSGLTDNMKIDDLSEMVQKLFYTTSTPEARDFLIDLLVAYERKLYSISVVENFNLKCREIEKKN